MANNIFVCVELLDDPEDVSHVDRALEEFADICRVTLTTWYISTSASAAEVATKLWNVMSSVGISIVIAQLTEGSRRIYAILNNHINPFNHAIQMPDVRGLIDLGTDKGRAMADVMLNLQAQIIAFSQDYQLVMIFILCSIPLAIMIGSTKAALRKQAAPPDHAVME